MLSFLRPSRIYLNQITNTRRQLCAFMSTIPIQSNVNHEVIRRLSLCIPLSGSFYSAHSKEKLLTNCRHWAQISLQSFSSSSGSGRLDDSRTLMVAGLSKQTTVAALRECFRKKWGVTNCIIVRDKITGASLQYGFVEFATAEEAKHALEFDHFIDGKQVNVKLKGNTELEEKYRIFVGGLLKETSGETLHDHFSKFGDIFDCSIVDRVLNSQPHPIDNKVVIVKHATPRQKELTLFIGNLSPKTTDESLREHFSKYGQLTQCHVKTDPKTGQSRGFGHVGFASQKELERARAAHHIIDGVEVSFKSRWQELVVDSLAPNITEESLQKFFSQYGQVQDCEITKNSIGTTTGFVTMSNEEEISRALTDRPHRIDGKLVFTHQKGEALDLIVGGIPNTTTDKDLYDTFSKAGNLVYWQVMRDWKNKTNRPLGYAYISFSSGEDLDRVMERQQYSIHGTPVSVQRRLGRKKETIKN
ncbi:RNA recognition motif domain-containing protein [Ditylenchus destructor]|nr:RNA recognition motif domain-containing protein [Ditylenchus destructor]